MYKSSTQHLEMPKILNLLKKKKYFLKIYNVPPGCVSGCGGSLAGYSHCQPDQHTHHHHNGIQNGYPEQEGVQNGYSQRDPVLQPMEQHIVNGQNGYCNGHDNTDSNGHQGKDEGGGSHYR